MKLHDIALVRSGDKGNRATLTVVVLDPQHHPGHYALLMRVLTAQRVQAHYAGVVHGAVRRYGLPQLAALQFVMDAALGGGVTRSLALDAHGKTLAAALLDLALDENPQAPAPPLADNPDEAPAPPGLPWAAG